VNIHLTKKKAKGGRKQRSLYLITIPLAIKDGFLDRDKATYFKKKDRDAGPCHPCRPREFGVNVSELTATEPLST